MDGSNNAFITDSEFLSFLEKSVNGTKKFTKLGEKILSNHWGFQFMTNDFMFKAFNTKVKQLVESGLAELIIKNATSANVPKSSNQPVVLTMIHLEIWFKILIMMMIIAFLSFFIEIIIKRKNEILNKVLSNRFARYVVRSTSQKETKHFLKKSIKIQKLHLFGSRQVSKGAESKKNHLESSQQSS